MSPGTRSVNSMKNGLSDIECLDACPQCGEEKSLKLPVPANWIGQEIFGDLQGKLGLTKCCSCKLIYTNPRPSSERLSAFYSGDSYTCHESAGSSSAGAKAEFLLTNIAKYLPLDAPPTLLDYGAGGGGFLTHARNRGWLVRGFEPGLRGLESCQKAGLNVTDNLDELPSGEFSFVTLHHVFEHLANPIDVLDGIRRLLTTNGRLYVEVPNAHSLRSELANPWLSRRFAVDERYRAFPIHLFYYTHGTLRETFKKAGWRIETNFTVGMGLDEFFVRREMPHTPKNHFCMSNPASPSILRSIRHTLRDGYLALGLGENLAAIARPL